MREPAGADDASAPSTSGSHPRVPRAASRHSGHNIFRLLVQREVSPQTKYSSGNLRENTSKSAKGARHGLISWAEAESLGHLTAKYCPLSPPPRSTIAAAFSSDGNTLASTHGDHTVKIINCQTGNCSKVLSGHQRTPWVVRFHPLYPEILASGSLDHYVRLWNATTGDCIGSHDFYKPIASIAFHAQGELLAVASGRKLFMWHYKRSGENSAPTIVLKTRRSLRAVHFHPHAAPFLLTAEVNNLNSSDTSATTAAASNNLHYPPPIVYMSNANSNEHLTGFSLTSLPFLVWPPLARDGRRASSQHSMGSVDPSISVRLLTYSTPSGQYELLLSPIEPNGSSATPEETGTVSLASEPQNMVTQSAMDVTGTNGLPPVGRSNQLFPFSDLACWELPFLHGWLLGQSQANQSTTHPMNGGLPENSNGHGEMENFVSLASLLTSVDQFRVPRRSRYHCSRSRFISTTKSLEDVPSNAVGLDESNPQPVSRFQSELATALAAAAAAAELPCTVRLRIWRHDVKEPSALLDAERCLLTIPHAVLCSEMGAHFSPCGRFLAACVACILPHLDGDPQFQSQVTQDSTGPTSPTRHPNAAHQIVYELRVYSLEASTFGLVLASRAIRAAHCLTSIQFSPTSEHLLLAYGRRHSSLLKSVVIDRETTMPIYTILEVYKVSNMELLRVISSAEDEVNVACFHPSIGGGLVYGTKEGKLRILQNGGSCQFNGTATFVPIDGVIEDEMGPHPVCVFVNDDR